jgi:molybdopterin molybdotransferase
MISVEQADAILSTLIVPLDPKQDCEIVPLASAVDRILAADAKGQLDFPHWDNSAMDGYAVQFVDVQAASADSPVNLTIVAEIPAGVAPQCTLTSGQCARIFTGSMIPAGADTIVIKRFRFCKLQPLRRLCDIKAVTTKLVNLCWPPEPG